MPNNLIKDLIDNDEKTLVYKWTQDPEVEKILQELYEQEGKEFKDELLMFMEEK